MKEIDIKIEVSPEITAWDPDKEVFFDCDLMPMYAHEGDAGFDLRANIESPIRLLPGKRDLIPTGIRIELPEGYELQVRPRSGLAKNYGISVVNAPGTVDSSFRGEIGVILINLGGEDFTIYPGDRIAQGVVKEYVKANLIRVEKINRETERGEGGYGSTGKL